MGGMILLRPAAFAVLVIGLNPHLPAADTSRILPVDKASRDPSFVAFRTRLREIVKQRKTEDLIAVLDKNVVSSFGGDNGVKGFRERWELDKDPAKSPVWKELDTILSLGGAWQPNAHGVLATFCAPYVYTQMPEDESENPALAAVLGPNVPLRSAPRDSAGVIRRLSYDRVRIVSGEGEYRWRRIQTLDKIEGYVRSTEVRSAGDARACFDKKLGEWKLTSLVTGD